MIGDFEVKTLKGIIDGSEPQHFSQTLMIKKIEGELYKS